MKLYKKIALTLLAIPFLLAAEPTKRENIGCESAHRFWQKACKEANDAHKDLTTLQDSISHREDNRDFCLEMQKRDTSKTHVFFLLSGICASGTILLSVKHRSLLPLLVGVPVSYALAQLGTSSIKDAEKEASEVQEQEEKLTKTRASIERQKLYIKTCNEKCEEWERKVVERCYHTE